MKIKMSFVETVDIEREVEVDLEECISEMMDIADGARALASKKSALEGATLIMSALDPVIYEDSIRKNPGFIPLLRERLGKWIEFLKQHGEG